MNCSKKLALFALIAFGFTTPSFAQETGKETGKENAAIPKEEKSVTKHSVVIGGKTINYTATAGALI